MAGHYQHPISCAFVSENICLAMLVRLVILNSSSEQMVNDKLEKFIEL
jgi:hypothetical protein